MNNSIKNIAAFQSTLNSNQVLSTSDIQSLKGGVSDPPPFGTQNFYSDPPPFGTQNF